MSRILRYEVPADGEWHSFTGHDFPLYVNCRQLGIVEFWAMERYAIDQMAEYRVFGTGEPLGGVIEYVGTTLDAGGRLVWHLMRRA